MERRALKPLVMSLYVGSVMAFLFFRNFAIVSGWMNINILFLVLSLFFFAVMFVLSARRFYLSYDDLWLIAFASFIIVDGVFRTPYKAIAAEYWSMLLATLAFKLVLQQERKSVEQYMRGMKACAEIGVFSILIQAIAPSVIAALCTAFFTVAANQTVIRTASLGYYTGITSQSAAAIWFCAIMLSFCFAEVFCQRKKNARFIILALLGFLAMLLTQKRSVLVAAIASLYVCYFVFTEKRNTRLFRLIWISFVLLILLYVAAMYIPQVQFMIQKTQRVGRALSGRETFWKDMLLWFQSSPVVGVGGGACQNAFGVGGHNCYLQLLAEYGIVGIILFFFAFLLSLLRTLYLSRFFIRENRDTPEARWLIASIYMQVVFCIYCITGNPLFDNIFLIAEVANIGVSNYVLRKTKPIRKKRRMYVG